MANHGLHPVKFAYHVTNVPYGSQKPNWDKLLSKPAYTDYDGVIRGQNCVFFSTTLYRGGRGGLPDKSVYPYNGMSGNLYWRVKVPINWFDNYEIWYCNSTMTQNGVEQVLLVMARPYTLSRQSLPGSNLSNDAMLINQHLSREIQPGRINYYSNVYNDFCKKFVNIAVLDDVPLTVQVEWDAVQKY